MGHSFRRSQVMSYLRIRLFKCLHPATLACTLSLGPCLELGRLTIWRTLSSQNPHDIILHPLQLPLILQRPAVNGFSTPVPYDISAQAQHVPFPDILVFDEASSLPQKGCSCLGNHTRVVFWTAGGAGPQGREAETHILVGVSLCWGV